MIKVLKPLQKTIFTWKKYWSTSWQRGRQRQRGDIQRTWGRGSWGQRSGRGQLVSSKNDGQEKILPITSICIKKRFTKESFSFTPVVSPGFCLPDGTDTSDPESLFKLFFSSDIVKYICYDTDNSFFESEHQLLLCKTRSCCAYCKEVNNEIHYSV